MLNTFLEGHCFGGLSERGLLLGAEAIESDGFVFLGSDVVIGGIVVEVDRVVSNSFLLGGNSAEEGQSGQGQIQLHLV